MSLQISFFLIVSILIAAALSSLFLKTTSRGFSNDPSQSIYKGQDIRQESSQRIEELAERQRRMMESRKDRLERIKF